MNTAIVAPKPATWRDAGRAAASSVLLFCRAVGAAACLVVLANLLFLKIVFVLGTGAACDWRDRFMDTIRKRHLGLGVDKYRHIH
jgi:hypothetical protein